MQRRLVDRWLRLNYGDALRPPRLRHRAIRSRDASGWAEMVATLTGSGYIHPTPQDEERLRELLDLPAAPAEFCELLE